MKRSAVAFAAEAKGPRALFRRAHTITQRYGRTPAKLEGALHLFARILSQFDCGATFPLTAVALERNGSALAQFMDSPIEFAAHGYTHVDYAQLTPDDLVSHLRRACEAFARAGIPVTGFRSPYLSRNPYLQSALEAAGFSYVSNQPILWDVVDNGELKLSSSKSLERALNFYDPWDARQCPSLPRLQGRLLEIPVSLPDDEILVDRLGGETDGLMKSAWLRILSQAHDRGELFAMMLHPERIAGCAEALSAVLGKARELTPQVWVARLEEIATWWQARARAKVQILDLDSGGFRLEIAGPAGTATLVRGVEVDQPALTWAEGYRQVKTNSFTVQAPPPLRPFIGVSTRASSKLSGFLRQQGYIVEISDDSEQYALYLDRREFGVEQELPLLAEIEGSDHPHVRLSRWPGGARSALAITGDIDALTLWDYGLRILGR